MAAKTPMPLPVTAVLAAAENWLPSRMAEVEIRLHEIAAGGGELAVDAEETLAAGGKRMRPMLVLLCAGEEVEPRTLRAATAVELVHMATLVHDDVLDAAPLRRGRPTVYADGGRGRAVSVGDYLLAKAFAELVDELDNADRALVDRQVALLTGSSVALARGELVQRRDAFNLGISVESYLERCRLKTAKLFECACTIGLAGDRDTAAALAEFGNGIGLAFQMFDDVLDIRGPSERTGKARGTDLIDGTVTLPLIVARERDSALAGLDLGKLDPAEAETICDRIVATGALDVVRDRALQEVERAKAALAAPAISDQQKYLLSLVADGVVDRYA